MDSICRECEFANNCSYAGRGAESCMAFPVSITELDAMVLDMNLVVPYNYDEEQTA